MSTKKNEKKILISKSLKKLRKFKDITLKYFSQQTEIKLNVAISYEREENKIPSLNKIIKISNYYNISIDYLLFWETTDYTKNLKFIKLSKKLDDHLQPHGRALIEETTKSFLNKFNINRKNIKQDIINIDLAKNIHENINILREKKELSTKELSEYLNVNQSQIYHYQNKAVPPVNKLLKLSDLFNISIHALATGEVLNFKFKDGHFGDTMLLADRFLSLEHQKFLIELMENIINNNQETNPRPPPNR